MTEANRVVVSEAQAAAPSTANPGTTVVARAATTLSWRHRLTSSLALPVMSVMVLIVVLGSIKNPLFYSPDTWSNILRASSFIIIVACFEALVMISGGIDLSVGASFLAGAMAAAYMVQNTGSIALAFAGALLVGLAIGLINGFLASWLMISPIIATLGTLFGVGAIIITLSGGLAIGPLPESFSQIGNISLGPIPGVFVYAILIAAGVHIVLEYTDWGTRIRAIGGNREAAIKVGINARRTAITVYAMTGMFSALAGLLQAASLGSGSPSFGIGMELKVIAAVIIGGVSIYGAIGTIPGVVAGSVLLSLITVGLVLLQISGSMQNFFIGLVLIIAVIIDRFRKERMFKASVDKVKTP
jgi:ribose/xylose/arabinose/galactoside ABC-type transport system permease subunit